MASREQRSVPTAPAPPSQVRLSWLLSALFLLLVAALGCAYVSLCLLFAQGQWQLLYHPAAAVTSTPAAVGLAFQPVQFGSDEAGLPQLTGWWLPAPASSSATVTILYLHDGTGSLSDTVPALARIHGLGYAVFVFDYRGYGKSAPGHPSEAKMIEDARAALRYLLETRHIAKSSVVLWGKGIGATIAAEASGSSQLTPLVLESVNPPARRLLAADPRSRFLPLRLLLRDHLDAAPTLAASRAPKLFLIVDTNTAELADSTQQLYVEAAQPKQLSTAANYKAASAFLTGVTPSAER